MLPLLWLSALPVGVLGADILGTTGFSTCMNNADIQVKTLNVQYNKNTRAVTFDIAGQSKTEQKVEGTMLVTAYGKTVYEKSFNPCDYPSMKAMCPVPAASFSSTGEQTIPEEYASQIPSIAFSVPDLDGNVQIKLKNVDSGDQVGCIESSVGNGKTLNMPAISYAAAGIAAAALALSALGALASGGQPGAATSSPTFTEVIHWFQGIATNGMLSVQYPRVYQSFTTNFAFSTGLVPWGQLQNTVDNFRNATGGNLTQANYPYLKNNVTLVYSQPGGGDNSTSAPSLLRRAVDGAFLVLRDGTEVNVNGTSAQVGGDGSTSSADGEGGKDNKFVSGIQAYAEELTIPQANTFMTVLLIWAIVVAAIIVLILLFKVILEGWALIKPLPKYFESWRNRYWWRMAKAIINLILMLYGVWVMYCIYQFTNGDSWAAKLLAGVTLGIFTIVLAYFTWRIYSKAHQYKRLDGDSHKLFDDKETWIKYSLFYDSFKRSYWMFFVPAIIYMFAKGCVIAGANGHGLVQAGGQLIIEAIMLVLLLWTRPYQLRSGRWINLFIHVVRVLSVVCILVFVEELGLSQTTKTITGVVLIVVQCVLTGILAILIAVNALIVCIKENPHRRQRKEAEKLNRDLDNLTPLDARNSLLMEPMAQHPNTEYKGAAAVARTNTFGTSRNGDYDAVPPRAESPVYADSQFSRPTRYRDDDREHLVSDAAGMGYRRDRSASHSRSPSRQEPKLPDLDFGFGPQSHAR